MPLITTIEDLRKLAQKRVPRMFYDYADSGSWTESTYRANETDFARPRQYDRPKHGHARGAGADWSGGHAACRW